MNTKMKVLSLAVIGLFGYAASAAAVCPTALDAANGGAWTAVSVAGSGSSATSVPGGYDSSACKLQASIGQGTAANGKAIVLDDSPANETRYRAQFIVDPSGISLTQANRAAVVFNVIGSSAPAAPAGISTNMLQVFLRGNGSAPSLRILTGDTATPGGYNQTDVALPNAAGANRVEIDLTVANGTGSLKYWINDAATTGITEASGVTASSSLTNAGWTGVDKVTLGLGGATAAWRTNLTSTSYVFFDQFDSRRQTFIGH